MTIDPQAQRLLDQMAAQAEKTPSPGHTLTEAERVANTRKNYRGAIGLAGKPEPVARVYDRTIPGTGGPIPARVYQPLGRQAPYPILIWFHGGGFISGDLDTHDTPLRSLANRLDFPIVAVAWRLAPEFPFPAGCEDAYSALRWAATGSAPDLDVDASRIAVGGDSAGGTIAAVLTHLARDRAGPPIAFQALLYPNTDLSRDGSDYPSWRDNDGRILKRSEMEKNFTLYGGAAKLENPALSPIKATDLSRLPPALVITGEADPQRDEGEAYARRLDEAGVSVDLVRYPGMIHGFFQMAGVLDAGHDLIERLAASIRAATGTS